MVAGRAAYRNLLHEVQRHGHILGRHLEADVNPFDELRLDALGRDVGRGEVVVRLDPQLGGHLLAVNRLRGEGRLFEVEVGILGMLPGDGVAGMLLAYDAERHVARHILVVGAYGYLIDVVDQSRTGERTAGRFGQRAPFAPADAELDIGDGIGVGRQQVAVEVAVTLLGADAVEPHARILLEEHRVAAVGQLLLDAVAGYHLEIRVGHRDVDRERCQAFTFGCREFGHVDGVVHVDVDMLHVVALEARREDFTGGERQRKRRAGLVVATLFDARESDEVGCQVQHRRCGACGVAARTGSVVRVVAGGEQSEALYEKKSTRVRGNRCFMTNPFFGINVL